jgi:hypothetical protein
MMKFNFKKPKVYKRLGSFKWMNHAYIKSQVITDMVNKKLKLRREACNVIPWTGLDWTS